MPSSGEEWDCELAKRSTSYGVDRFSCDALDVKKPMHVRVYLALIVTWAE
jgi:hypothetical protein